MKPSNFEDHTGSKFGLWLAVEYLGSRKWRCICDCGTEKSVATQTLKHGQTKSCGCNKGAMISKNRVEHGHSAVRTGTYRSWDAMIQRCTNKKNNRYEIYGAIGVTVCDRWKLSFANFLADMGEKPSGLTIDRKNPYGNYEPGNCRWATYKEQANNRRNSAR